MEKSCSSSCNCFLEKPAALRLQRQAVHVSLICPVSTLSQADRDAGAGQLAEARQQLCDAGAAAERAASDAAAQRAAAAAAALEAKAAELAALRSQLER